MLNWLRRTRLGGRLGIGLHTDRRRPCGPLALEPLALRPVLDGLPVENGLVQQGVRGHRLGRCYRVSGLCIVADRAGVDIGVGSMGSCCGAGDGGGGGSGGGSGSSCGGGSGGGCTDEPAVGFYFVFTGCVACL